MRKTKKAVVNLLVLVVLFGFLTAAMAGNLQPPGAPGSTMKTLDQVEARIPIKPSDMPKTISSSGSYYLTDNFTATTASHGIFITASNVTIDLNGYSLDGNSVGKEAIAIDAGIINTTIRNGNIHNFSDAGIYSEESERTYVENVHIDTVPGEGFFLSNASTAIGCSATNCSWGFVVGDDSIITRCTARNNTNKGFSSSNNCVITECVASGNGSSGLENVKILQDIETRIPIPASNTATGVFTINASGSYYLQGNRSCSGTGIQINADNVTIDFAGFSLIGPGFGTNYGVVMNGRSNIEIRNGSVCRFYHGIYEQNSLSKSHRIIDLRASSNVNSGIYLLGSNHLVKDCTASYNGYTGTVYVYGIRVGIGNIVTGCTVYNNGKSASNFVYGIHTDAGCTVNGNVITSNGESSTGGLVYAVSVGDGCTVTSNTVFDNGRNATGNVRGIHINRGVLL